jgi:hypothetical protein
MALHWNTVTPTLKEGLQLLMTATELHSFRLVGGTALSLQRGHRLSVDIDLFSDAIYGSIDFKKIDQFLRSKFEYVSPDLPDNVAMGMSYIAGKNELDSFKLDIYYTDTFIRPLSNTEGIRMADVEDIIAMKIDIVQRGARKKDFWDLHELLDEYGIDTMIALHEERYPYGHDEGLIKNNLKDFAIANDDLEPVCLKGKHWEVIRADMMDLELD